MGDEMVTRKAYDEIRHAAFEQIEALRAERDRYKVALKKIAHSPYSIGKWAMDIAEEALESEKSIVPERYEWKEASGLGLGCKPGTNHCWHRLRWSVPIENCVSFLDNAKKGERWEQCCWCGKRRLDHRILELVQTHGEHAPEYRCEADTAEEWGD